MSNYTIKLNKEEEKEYMQKRNNKSLDDIYQKIDNIKKEVERLKELHPKCETCGTIQDIVSTNPVLCVDCAYQEHIESINESNML